MTAVAEHTWTAPVVMDLTTTLLRHLAAAGHQVDRDVIVVALAQARIAPGEPYGASPGDAPAQGVGHDAAREVVELATGWGTHVTVLSDHRHGVAPLQPPGLAHHAVGALGRGRELIRLLQEWRPRLVVDALAADADRAVIAREADFAGAVQMEWWLVLWANHQLRTGEIDPGRHAAVLALVGIRGER